MKIVREAATGTLRMRNITAVIILDVKNAFNSLRWDSYFCGTSCTQDRRLSKKNDSKIFARR